MGDGSSLIKISHGGILSPAFGEVGGERGVNHDDRNASSEQDEGQTQPPLGGAARANAVTAAAMVRMNSMRVSVGQ
ncbi:MAG: hypothetical protein MK010_00080 [Erythrobacter sp.]|nr:hypothetical protein [Erythrobacter sp.]